MSANVRGAILMMLSMAGFTVNDTFLKALSDEMGLFQAVFLRGVFTTLFLVLMTLAMRQFSLRLSRRDWALSLLRALSEAAAAFLFITALFHMPIANVAAILQALPLTITLAGALFLGEVIGWRRMLAILAGFAGVLMIVRPGAEGFNIYAVYAVLAVLAVTVRDIASRQVSHRTPSMMIAVISAVVVTFLAGLFSLGESWAPVSRLAAMQLTGSIVFVCIGYVTSVSAMRFGEIAFVAPFRYSSLIWALVLGLFVFGDWPDLITLIGSVIVVGTGIYTFMRERRLARRLAAEAEPGPV